MFWKTIFIFLIIIWFFLRTLYRKKSLDSKSKVKKGVNLERFLVFLNLISMIILPIFVVFNSSLDFAAMNLSDIIRWLSTFIYAINLIFFAWCHASLGKNWSNILEIKKDHQLIKNGPYKKIRHPMYAHFWILIISQGLILDNWIVLVYGLLAWGTLYFLRVRKEENMMMEEFGDQYKEYMKETGRLIPKIK